MNRGTSGGILARAAALALCVILVVGAAFAYERREQRMEKERLAELAAAGSTIQNARDDALTIDGQTYTYDHRLETYLFIGTDDSGNEDAEEGDVAEYSGSMADFLLLMVLDYTDDTFGCIQIDRNTVTQVDELSETGEVITTRDLQICTAHWYGYSREMSAENTEASVSRLLGGLSKIDGYYVLNMKDIGKLNHLVGGVRVTIQEDLTAADPAFEKGRTLTLTDRQAERFVRARMSVTDGTNENRMSRHRQYMEGLIDQVKYRTGKDSEFYRDLWDGLRKDVVTDMHGNDFSRISQMFLKGEDKGIFKIEGQTRLGMILGDGEEHEEFYPEWGSIRDIMIELFSLIPLEEDSTEGTASADVISFGHQYS